MRHDDKDHDRRFQMELQKRVDETHDEGHIVFDFTGMEQATVGDLSIILTARLKSSPTEAVWVRSLPARTARILEHLRLDHLFRRYPEAAGPLN
jgi:hypothetical protein